MIYGPPRPWLRRTAITAFANEKGQSQRKTGVPRWRITAARLGWPWTCLGNPKFGEFQHGIALTLATIVFAYAWQCMANSATSWPSRIFVCGPIHFRFWHVTRIDPKGHPHEYGRNRFRGTKVMNFWSSPLSVSYTHLTLPTIYSV